MAGAVFIAPATIFFGMFLLLPVVTVALIAFTKWAGFDIHNIPWAGTANFRQLASDAVFVDALLHTLIFVVCSTVLLNVVGLSLASLINTRVRGNEFLRIAVFLPLALSPVLTAILWNQVLGPYGLINSLLVDTLQLRTTPIGFLGDPDLALWTVIGASVWQYAGYNTLLYYAGLQSLPQERVEAARIDGAGVLNRLRHVIVPFLRPVIAVVVILNLIGGWKVFDLVYVLTGGGPDRRTEVLSTYLYEQGFRFNLVGYASTIGLVIIALATISALLRGQLTGARA